MKVLVVIPSGPKQLGDKTIPAKYSGVDFHRLLVPHSHLSNIIDISQINDIENITTDFANQFDLIVVNRFISRQGRSKEVLEVIKASTAKLVFDIDDDYKLPDWHILAGPYKKDKHAEQILFGLKNADAITTTHNEIAEILAREAMNKNIFVVPNGIDPTDEQFKIVQPQNKRVTFGWSGSITHFEDVLLMHDSLYSLYKSQYKDDFCMIYGGHDPKDQHSNLILSALSCKGLADEKNFGVYGATSVHEYAKFYNLIDVALIPLRDNRFNRMKSNLKLLEAGFKKKAVIVSGVDPYLPILRHGVNCLVVKNKHDWYRHMTKLINNQSLIKDLSEQLYQDVQEFHISDVSHQRLSAYQQILSWK